MDGTSPEPGQRKLEGGGSLFTAPLEISVVRAQAVSRFVALVFVGWLLVCASGCDSLSEFKGTFSGSVVPGSFVRSCFSTSGLMPVCDDA